MIDPDVPRRASLVDRILRTITISRAKRLPWRREAIVTWWIGVGAIAVALVVPAIVADWRTRRLETETTAMEAGSPLARTRAEALADAFARPGPAATLATLDAHLPPDLRIASVSTNAAGLLRIAIDTPDPDVLNRALAGDRWLAEFHVRSEDQNTDGGFHVVLERRTR